MLSPDTPRTPFTPPQNWPISSMIPSPPPPRSDQPAGLPRPHLRLRQLRDVEGQCHWRETQRIHLQPGQQPDNQSAGTEDCPPGRGSGLHRLLLRHDCGLHGPDWPAQRQGDHVLCVSTVYGPVRAAFTSMLPRFGVETTFFPTAAAADLSGYLRPQHPDDLRGVALHPACLKSRNLRAVGPVWPGKGHLDGHRQHLGHPPFPKTHRTGHRRLHPLRHQVHRRPLGFDVRPDRRHGCGHGENSQSLHPAGCVPRPGRFLPGLTRSAHPAPAPNSTKPMV